MNDKYLTWEELNAGPNTIPYYRVTDIKTEMGVDFVGNEVIPQKMNYDTTINRKSDKRLT